MHTTQAHAVSARENAAAELTRESHWPQGQGLAGPSSSDTSPSHDVEEKGGNAGLMLPTLPPSSRVEQRASGQYRAAVL